MIPTPKQAQESANRANCAESVALAGAATYPSHVRGMATVRARVARLDRARRNGYRGPLTRAEVTKLAARNV